MSRLELQAHADGSVKVSSRRSGQTIVLDRWEAAELERSLRKLRLEEKSTMGKLEPVSRS